MQTVSERLTPKSEIQRKLLDQLMTHMRVAVPGIIQSFNASSQTVTVQPSIRERVNLEGNPEWKEIPLLVDVPVFMPRAGGYVLTMPVKAGDECLVVFGDSCMDAWWQSGGVQNQAKKRRHDLSDGYAIVGIWSQPRVVSSYHPENVQLRNDAGDAYFEIDPTGKVRIQGRVVQIHADEHWSWDVDGYGQKIKSLGGGSYEITTWQRNASVSNVTKDIAPPEDTGDE